MTVKPLITNVSLSLTPHPLGADISRGDAAAAVGPGVTTLSWVCRGSVVAFCRLVSMAYASPTTPRRKIASHVCACMCARAYARKPVSWRRGVVALSYLFEKKEKTYPYYPRHRHDAGPQSVVAFANLLKNNKIFGVYCHVA